ncbi:RNA polymerase sigma factor [Zhaonella formicivorans]|uniref:RNA polymerase sigma factor n=1 Tax=Zhaonella formicivorans TaxID=2528593 RepID=UPI0010D6A621|nr:sigma-70 family RNA polymerase sigma factor [Zhaonella formicivorans]
MRDETLEQLLLKEANLVFKYLIKMGASKEDAEDIVQETLYKTIKNIDAIDGHNMRAWLFKVAINSYYSLYNKKKKQSTIAADHLQNLKMLTESTEDYCITEEKRKVIQKALDLLKPSYRELLIFKYVMELSYRDIANLLETSEEKVKVYLYRARNKFKEIWEGLNLE